MASTELTTEASGTGAVPTGAVRLFDALVAAGTDVCFANPGTTEMPLVKALDARTDVRAVLGLFEGVCSGAADGYARVSGRPASTLLHLGPGLANATANLHNARRAHTPIVNIIGDHASWHGEFDAPLTSDIAALAGTTSVWCETTTAADRVAAQTAVAVAAARSTPGIASLIVPVDHQWSDAPSAVPALDAPMDKQRVPVMHVAAVAERLRAADRPGLLLGGDAHCEAAQRSAAAVAQLLGARVWSETFPPIVARGRGRLNAPRLPYFPETAIAALDDVDVLVLVGAAQPVAYFGYEGIPSRLADPERVVNLAAPTEDATSALGDLAAALDAPAVTIPDAPPPAVADGATLDGRAVGVVLAGRAPEGAIVSVEGGTCGYPFFEASDGAAPHDVMTNTGGAIGQGLPCSLGAAIAAPDRPVIALQSDGSAQYTIQTLWTMAREGVDVTILIAANHRYRILQNELNRIGVTDFGATASGLTELAPPRIDWVQLARSYGVPGVRVADARTLDDALTGPFTGTGPRLVEMEM